MTRSEAIIQANSERERTGLPQLVGMRSDGVWYCRPIDGKRFDDIDAERSWERYEQADARQRVEDEAAMEWKSGGGR